MTDNRILDFEVVDVFLPVLLEAGLVARAVVSRLAVVARRSHLETIPDRLVVRQWPWIGKLACFCLSKLIEG